MDCYSVFVISVSVPSKKYSIAYLYKPGLWSRSQCLATVSRRWYVSFREKLSTSRSRLGLRRQTSWSRLGLGHLRLMPQTNFRPNCARHSKQCERALDIVSLCCSYYSITHHINLLKTMNVKDNI